MLTLLFASEVLVTAEWERKKKAYRTHSKLGLAAARNRILVIRTKTLDS